MGSNQEKPLKKISAFQLGLSVAGSILGAGYVSGQELWQYFVSFGWKGTVGMVLSLLLLGSLNDITCKLAYDTGLTTIDSLVVRKNIPWLKALVQVMTILFYLMVAGIMATGIGSLCNRIFGIPVWLGTILTLLLNAAVVAFGFTGLVRLFSLSVPVLIVSAVVISCLRLGSDGIGNFNTAASATVNPMISNWGISAVNYAFMNYFGMIPIITPIAVNARKRSGISLGSILGAFLLIVIALFIVLALQVSPQYCGYDLPMLEIASTVGKAAWYIYAFLLFLGMFQSCVACNNVIVYYGIDKYPSWKKYAWVLILLLCVVEFFMSIRGFSGLIAVVYPIAGYCAILIVVLIIEHRIHIHKQKK